MSKASATHREGFCEPLLKSENGSGYVLSIDGRFSDAAIKNSENSVNNIKSNTALRFDCCSTYVRRTVKIVVLQKWRVGVHGFVFENIECKLC